MYDFKRLSPVMFERLCQMLFVQEFDPDAKILEGPRWGPLDAIANVAVEKTGSFDTIGLIAKYSNARNPAHILRQRIRNDLRKLAHVDKYNHDYPPLSQIVLATSVIVSSQDAERLRSEFRQLGSELGLVIWDELTLAKLLDSYPDVRMYFIGEFDYLAQSFKSPPGTYTESVRANLESSFSLSPLRESMEGSSLISAAWWRLVSTHETVNGLFESLHYGTKMGESSSALTARQQDLLRAAIVFTSAGIDSCLSALLRHATPVLATYEEVARRRFELFIKEQVGTPKVQVEFMDALKSDSPRDQMMNLYINSITKASFQGSGSIKNRALAALGISNKQIDTSRLEGLNDFFAARNDVAHRLDLVEPRSPGDRPEQRLRLLEDVGPMCDQVFGLMSDIIAAAVENLEACQTSGQ